MNIRSTNKKVQDVLEKVNLILQRGRLYTETKIIHIRIAN